MGFLRKSITEIHDALINGLVTPEELLREALLKAHKDDNNAFEYICDEYAFSQLKELKNKDKSNLLWGIPYAIKDNFSVKDVPMTASSNILNNYTPIFNSEVVRRLNECGAILIGKTTLDEFGMGGHGTTGHKGPVFNPWDKSHNREIGGSSSGSAAVVSAGIVPFAIGTDTGDSVRKPASNACLIGFKPTWGMISRYGILPFAPSLDHVAFFTRNVYDSSIILKNIAGHDDKDLTSTKNKKIDFQLDGMSLKGKKVAIIKEIVDSMDDNKEKELFNKFVLQVKDNGGEIIYESIDMALCKAIFPTYLVISSSEATSNTACLDGIEFGNEIKDQSFEESLVQTRKNGFSNQIKRRLILGSYSLLKENKTNIYIKAQKVRRLIADEMNKILKNNDVVLLPASNTIAPKFGTKLPYSEIRDVIDNHLAIGNFAGLPSLTFPIGFVDGMPYGANITGKIFDEQNVLSFAAEFERITGIKEMSVKE